MGRLGAGVERGEERGGGEGRKGGWMNLKESLDVVSSARSARGVPDGWWYLVL